MNAMSSSSFKTGTSFNLVKGAHSVFKGPSACLSLPIGRKVNDVSCLELCDSVRRNYRLDKRESIR
jgi:hypothetical protein